MSPTTPRHATSYTTNARFVAFLGTFARPAQQVWLPGNDLQDPTSWEGPCRLGLALLRGGSRILLIPVTLNANYQGTTKADYDEATRSQALRNNHVLPCEASRPPRWGGLKIMSPSLPPPDILMRCKPNKPDSDT